MESLYNFVGVVVVYGCVTVLAVMIVGGIALDVIELVWKRNRNKNNRRSK